MEKIDNIFGIIKTGGKQYKVKIGDKLKIEKISEKEKIQFDDIMFGKKVFAAVTAFGKYPKVRILKFKPKKGYKRVTGHRQKFTEIQIEKIE